MAEMRVENLYERMRLLDERVDLEFENDGRFQIVIVGGGALILRGYISRATDDLDILGANSKIYGLMELYDMNGNVNAYMDNFPYNYEDRLAPLWSGNKIDYYTASLEDIVISKLCSNRGDDLSDIENVVRHIDWEILDKLAKDDHELRLNILSDRRYNDFLANYEQFEKRFRS